MLEVERFIVLHIFAVIEFFILDAFDFLVFEGRGVVVVRSLEDVEQDLVGLEHDFVDGSEFQCRYCLYGVCHRHHQGFERIFELLGLRGQGILHPVQFFELVDAVDVFPVVEHIDYRSVFRHFLCGVFIQELQVSAAFSDKRK